MTCETATNELFDQRPPTSSFLEDVLAGLGSTPKSLPSVHFYDKRGSELFDQICELDEYYLTRTELSIMEADAGEMAQEIGPGAMVVEFGSGSSVKTRILLDHLPSVAAYVPVDISRKHLQQSANDLASAYPELDVLPVCADFTAEFELPTLTTKATHRIVYFPGSTIGNFDPEEAIDLLERIPEICGTGGGLLIGIDLQKDHETLEAAYNDEEGVTAEFNLNLLRRINSELSGDFDLEEFEHLSVYDEKHGRMETSLVSKKRQKVAVSGRTFHFEEGEPIRTEYSHKYTIAGFSELLSSVGMKMQRHWTDDRKRFAVLYCAVANGTATKDGPS